jgi:gamma-glutamyltranspeptidase
VAAYGTPGGRTIVNNQAFFSLCLFAFSQDPAATLALPRAHCEEAEPVKLEKRVGEMTFDWLESLGHRVTPVDNSGGPAHILLAGPTAGEYHGATDPRGEGLVASE